MLKDVLPLEGGVGGGWDTLKTSSGGFENSGFQFRSFLPHSETLLQSLPCAPHVLYLPVYFLPNTDSGEGYKRSHIKDGDANREVENLDPEHMACLSSSTVTLHYYTWNESFSSCPHVYLFFTNWKLNMCECVFACMCAWSPALHKKNMLAHICNPGT